MTMQLGVDLDPHIIKMLSSGDDICLNIWTSEKDPMVMLKAETTKVVIMNSLPLTEQHRLYSLWATDLWEFFLMAYSDQVGPERCLNALRPLFTESGSKDLARIRKMCKEGHEDEDMPEIIGLILSQLRIKSEIIRNTEGNIEARVYECPFSSARKDMCELFHEYLEGMLHGVSDGCVLDCQRRSEDADHCTLIIGEVNKTDPVKPTMDDVLIQLKMRLARGEISKMEYEELLSIIMKG